MSHCRGQLLQRVRRGLASSRERIAFEAHLERCVDCRLDLDVMDDFGQVEVANPEDVPLIARMATATRQIHDSVSLAPPRRPRQIWTISAAALVLAGGAAAGGFGWSRLAPTQTEGSRPVRLAPPGTTVEATEAGRTEPPSEPALVEARGERAPLPEPRVSARSAASAPGVAPPTARELYRLANQRRRAGQTAPAIAAYQSLQKQYPGSAEARLSHVSLGGLLLRSGSAGPALQQFSAYLEGGNGQRLAAEALYGRGRALQALGRTAKEGENWQRLLREYPDSAYATHASHRLAQLRSGTPRGTRHGGTRP